MPSRFTQHLNIVIFEVLTTVHLLLSGNVIDKAKWKLVEFEMSDEIVVTGTEWESFGGGA